ncbi:MAG: dihydrolipoyl dehydrogenase [Candidatus Hermodarchaeota archaeon]
MTTKKETDIAVIGAGPGGYVAAIRAVQLGAKVILIEKDAVGGTCLNRGCIPTKALVESAVRYNKIREANKFGISVKDLSFDFTQIQRRKNQIVKRLVKGIEFLIKSRGIETLHGLGSFVDANTIKVTGGEEEYEVTASKIIIATGSKSGKVPIQGIDGKNVITSEEMLEISEVPESIVVIGGGVIGAEFASIFNTFGSKVTVIELLPTLIPMEDQEVGLELEKAFKRHKITVHTNSRVTTIGDKENGEKVINFFDKDTTEQQVSAQYVLLAVGRFSQLDGLNLDAAGVKYRRGIYVNKRMETNVTNIYAIGDAIEMDPPSPMLAYTASQEGEVAAENAMGHNVEMNYHAVPSVIFTEPEVASVGFTEKTARENIPNVLVGRFPFQGLGKAAIMGEGRGFIKVLLNGDTKEIIGASIIGPHATELIAELTLAVQNKLKLSHFVETQHSHPVLYEGIKEAVLDAEGRAIHK